MTRESREGEGARHWRCTGFHIAIRLCDQFDLLRDIAPVADPKPVAFRAGVAAAASPGTRLAVKPFASAIMRTAGGVTWRRIRVMPNGAN